MRAAHYPQTYLCSYPGLFSPLSLMTTKCHRTQNKEVVSSVEIAQVITGPLPLDCWFAATHAVPLPNDSAVQQPLPAHL